MNSQDGSDSCRKTGGSLFQRGGTTTVMEQSENFSEKVTGRAEEESVVISKAAKEAGMYSPLLDDTKNISKTEQTSIYSLMIF